MDRQGRVKSLTYTKEELVVLAGIRRSSGRTCRSCAWFRPRDKQRGCFPEGKYRKWLSLEEFDSGCDLFAPADAKVRSAGARI